jgi:hypothetical protein
MKRVSSVLEWLVFRSSLRWLLPACLSIAGATAAAQGLPAGLLPGIAPIGAEAAVSAPPSTSAEEWQARLEAAQSENLPFTGRT